MGWLLTFLSTVLGPIITSVAQRYFIAGIIITSLILTTGLLATALNTILASNVFTENSSLVYVGVLIPSNFSLCIGLIVDALLLKTGYDFVVNKLTLLK